MAGRDGVSRILDVNFNRAREALRVAEDYVRFVRDDAACARRVRTIRHDLEQAARDLPGGLSRALTARDSEHDIARTGAPPEVTPRGDAEAVALANFKRATEALRSLEEFAKTVSPGAAARFESLRFAVYSAERRALVGEGLGERIARARLCVLISSDMCRRPVDETIERAIAGGAGVIQLREKTVTDAAFEALAGRAREITLKGGAILIINDRADIAVAADADGVHLGQRDISCASARKILGPGRLIGISTHNEGQIEVAAGDGADYLGVGPVFATPTKPDEPAAGLEFVRLAAAVAPLPLFAIGGISADNIAEVRDAGASAVAVSSAVVCADDPERAARELAGALTSKKG